MSQSSTSRQRVQSAINKYNAVELRLRGLTYAQIGEQLGISAQAAWKQVKNALAVVNAETKEETRELIEIERERLESMIVLATVKAEQGVISAITEVRHLSESLRRLQGLDQPTRTDVTSGGDKISIRLVESDED